MPVLTKINTNVIADDAVTAAKIPAGAVGASEIPAGAVGSSELADDAVLPAKIAYLGDGTGTLSGTITGEQLRFGTAFTLTDDLTVNGDVTLGKVGDDSTGQSLTQNTSANRTLTGTGTLRMGSSMSSVEGMTGALGSAVTGSPALNLSNATQFPAGHVIQTQHVQAAGQSSTTTNSWNFVHDEIVLTITPLFGTSSILLHASFAAHKETGGYAQFDFYKNASDFTETYNVTGLDYGLALVNSLTHWSGLSMQWLDPVTENSTTEKTYKISLRSTDGNTAYCGWGAEGMSSITAWEIAQ